MKELAGVILAGGQGQRLGGVRKAHLKLGGIPLIDRVITSLALPAEAVVISIGHLPPAAFAHHPHKCLPDLTTETGGPLAGLAATVRYFLAQADPPEFVISSAVDVPFLPADFITRLTTAIETQPAAYPQVGDTFYPTNALWRLAAIANLPDLVHTNTAPKSLKHLLRALGAQPVEWPTDPNPFANINTMSDLLDFSRRLKN